MVEPASLQKKKIAISIVGVLIKLINKDDAKQKLLLMDIKTFCHGRGSKMFVYIFDVRCGGYTMIIEISVLNETIYWTTNLRIKRTVKFSSIFMKAEEICF